MMDKQELKEMTNDIALAIYKDVVNHDPWNNRLIYIKQQMSPYVRTIKEQQKEIEELKQFIKESVGGSC